MNTPVQDRKYQGEAVDASLSALSEADRAQVYMTCGSGKSFVQAMTVQKHLTDNPDLDRPIFEVFVPNRALVRQMEDDFRTILGDDIECLGVGSDQQKQADRKEGQMLMSTDVDDLKDKIDNREKPLVIFSTYQSTTTLIDALRQEDGSILTAELMQSDEAHRTAGEDRSKENNFSLVLHDEIIPAKKRLFYTATPNFTELSEGDRSQEELHSMDNEELYGKVVYDYPYSRALEEGVVAPLRIQAPILTEGEIEAYRVLNDLPESDRSLIISELSLNKVIETTGQNKILSFHNGLQRAERFAGRLNETLGPEGYNVTFISGDSSIDERRRAFEVMETTPSVVTSVDALGEGMNSKAVQVALFADPRHSVRVILQNLGRIQRIDPNDPNKIGTIVCPIIIDEKSKDTPEQQILNSDYKTIFRVTEALRASDNVAALSVKKASRHFGMTGELPSQAVGSEIEFMDNRVLSAEQMTEIQQALRLATFAEISDPFEENVGRMLAFINQNNRIPDRKDHARELSEWYQNNLAMAERGTLRRDRFEEIEKLQQTEQDLFKTSHEQNLRRLEGIILHPRSLKDIDRNDFPHLDEWIDQIRTEHAAGELSDENAERCEALPFFEWCDETTEYEVALRHQQRFLDRHGVLPDSEGSVAGNSEKSILIPIELENERLAEQSIQQVLSDPTARLRHVAGDITPEEAVALDSDDAWPLPKGDTAEDATLKALELFYETHNASPSERGMLAGRTEALLAREIDAAERSFVEAHLGPEGIVVPNSKSSEKMTPYHASIAQSPAFANSDADSYGLVQGKFSTSEDGKKYFFTAKKAKAFEGAPSPVQRMLESRWRKDDPVFELKLSKVQKSQVMYLGEQHTALVELGPGKEKGLSQPLSLKRIANASLVHPRFSKDRYEDYIVARSRDRVIREKPSLTPQSHKEAWYDGFSPVLNLDQKDQTLITNDAFVSLTETFRNKCLHEETGRVTKRNAIQCPGFSLYYHNDKADNFDKAVEFLKGLNLSRDIFKETQHRKSDTGLGNTLRELDKTVLKFKKSQNPPESVQQVKDQYKDEYRSLTVAARAIQEREAEEAKLKQQTAVRSKKSTAGNSGQGADLS